MRNTIITDSRSHLEFHWAGGHTINIYSYGQEVDVITFGFGSEPTYEKAMAAISTYLGE